MRVRRDAENLFESSLRLCHWIRPESRFTLKAHLETEHKFIDKSRGGWSTKTHLFAVDARTAPGTLAWAGHDAPAARLSNWPLKWGAHSCGTATSQKDQCLEVTSAPYTSTSGAMRSNERLDLTLINFGQIADGFRGLCWRTLAGQSLLGPAARLRSSRFHKRRAAPAVIDKAKHYGYTDLHLLVGNDGIRGKKTTPPAC